MQVRFSLNLTAEQYRYYYEGKVNAIQASSDSGQQIRFPAAVLRPYLTHSGIAGQFIIEFDEQHRFKSIEKVAEE